MRTKLLTKQMKKVKVFLIQRMIKKIKQTRSEEGENFKVDLQNFEVELLRLKSLDHLKLAEWTFNSKVLKENYLQEKIKELGIIIAKENSNEDIEGIEKICSVKCFQDAVKVCKEELCLFVKKLLHESYEIPVIKGHVVNKTAILSKDRQVTRDKPLSSDKSFFMESLNAEDSEMEENNEILGDRISFTDDEDEDGISEFEGEDKETKQPKKKKNRLGQLARRRLAERAYGENAKHIKNGGLTVQQKETQRLQKSQQRKERLARIKKDEALKPKSANKTETKSKVNLKVRDLFNNKTTESGMTQSSPKTTVQTTKIDPNMHPSWIAKVEQQNKAKLAATVKGQKIVFD